MMSFLKIPGVSVARLKRLRDISIIIIPFRYSRTGIFDHEKADKMRLQGYFLSPCDEA